MGFWDWILGKGAQDNVGENARGGDGFSSVGAGSSTTAVLEPPSARAPDDQQKAELEERWWAPEGATLTEQIEIQRPELSNEAQALEKLLISHFDGHDLTLPPLLHVAEMLLPHLRGANCDLAAVANGLAEDQVVAASVLRLANCPLYRGLSKIAGIRPAVNRLGTRALRTLLMNESLRAATFFRKKDQQEMARIIWRRSLAAACIMRSLADFTDLDKEDAFLIGLLHDVGNVVVLRILFGTPGAPGHALDAVTFEYLCYECHQEFGELIADAWSLPPNVKAVICDHHIYPSDEDPLRTTRLMIQLTNMIKPMLGYGPEAPYDLLASRVVADLGLTESDDFVAMLRRLPEEVDETVAAL